MSDQTPVTPQARIGVAAVLRAALKDLEDAEKKAIVAAYGEGAKLPVNSQQRGPDGRRLRLGTVSVNEGRISYDIDPAEAIPYVIDRYGPQAVEEIVQIRPQYRQSLEKEAEDARKAGTPLPPGVSVNTGDPYAAFYPARDIDPLALLQDMFSRGELDLQAALGGLLELPGRDQH